MGLNEEIKNLAVQNGITYFGVANLAPAREEILARRGQAVAAYPYAIALGITLFKPIVDQLPNRHQYAAALNYRHHAYRVINQRLDLIASLVSSIVQQQGYNVLPIPAAAHVDEEHLAAQFSHKMAAHLAGLGWIGKSCLLVTPEDGPRIRWISVLTDAPLKPTGMPMARRCGECRKCVDICPVQAFTGRPFDASEPREARYDARKCEEYFAQMKGNGQLPVCGMCLYVCPYGRK